MGVIMRQFILAFFVLSFVCASSVVAKSSEVPLPHSMAVLGDSISEGMLVEFSTEYGPSLNRLLEMLKITSVDTEEERKEKFRLHFAKIEHTWAGGDNPSDLVYSHYERLKEYVPDLKHYNFAVSGDSSFELVNQVDRLLEQEEKDDLSIDYITILIGANDLHAKKVAELTPPHIYSSNLETQFRRILDKDPNRRLLITGYPQIHEVFESTKDVVALDLILGVSYTCKEIRKSIYGQKILFKPEEKENYDIAVSYLHEYHHLLNVLRDRLNEDYPEAFIKTTDTYDSVQDAAKTMSIDCFHPSEWGHAEIAEHTWALGFWPELGDDFDDWF